MPRSQDTSTTRVPRRSSGRSSSVEVDQRCRGVLERAVDDDVALGQERCERNASLRRDHVAEVRRDRVVVELHDAHGVDRGPHGGDPSVGQHVHVVDAVGVECGHRATGGGTEADHDRGEPPPVVAGQPAQLQRLQHRAVAGQLVVGVEDVHPDGPVDGPVVHRLERDQGQVPVDRQLGQCRVLHAVRPAPQHLAGLDQRDVGELRLGQQHHVGGGDHLGAGREPGDERCQVVVGVARSARRTRPRA